MESRSDKKVNQKLNQPSGVFQLSLFEIEKFRKSQEQFVSNAEQEYEQERRFNVMRFKGTHN